MIAFFLTGAVAFAGDTVPTVTPTTAPVPVATAAAVPSPAAFADTGQHLSPGANACLDNAGVPKGLEADRVAEGVRSEAYQKCEARLETCATERVTYQYGAEVSRSVVANYACGRVGTSSETLRAPDYLAWLALPEAAAAHQKRLTTLNVVHYAGLGVAL